MGNTYDRKGMFQYSYQPPKFALVHAYRNRGLIIEVYNISEYSIRCVEL